MSIDTFKLINIAEVDEITSGGNDVYRYVGKHPSAVTDFGNVVARGALFVTGGVDSTLNALISSGKVTVFRDAVIQDVASKKKATKKAAEDQAAEVVEETVEEESVQPEIVDEEQAEV
jgi:formylmethanofuran dehydrogenase subunit C